MTASAIRADTGPPAKGLAWIVSDDLPLRVRVQRAAFLMTATTLVVIFVALTAVALVELPAVRLEANTQTATVIGAALSENLHGRLQDLGRLGRNPIMYTALTDSGERESYLKPFLASLHVGDERAPVMLLDYRGREVAGAMPPGVDAGTLRGEVTQVLSHGRQRLSVVPGQGGGLLLAAFPVTAPYTQDVIGVVMGAVDLASLLRANSAGLAEGLGVMLRFDGRPVARWPADMQGEYLAVQRPVPLDPAAAVGELDLTVYSTQHPWVRGVLLRSGISLAVGAVLALVFWQFSARFARRVTRRLDRLADSCRGVAEGRTEPIAEDSSRDEVGTLARTLRAAFTAYDRINDNLEALVAARTRSLAEREDELRRAMLAAEAASEAKSVFLRNMSHELRTPLNGVLGMTYLLRRTGLSTEQAGRVDKIDASAKRLLGIVTEVLDFTKLHSGDVALAESPLDVPRLLADAVAMVAPEAREKALPIEVRDDVDVGGLLGDRHWLAEALRSYLVNAVQFTAAGRITVHARCEDVTATSALLRIEVTDTGEGVAPEILPRLFADFEQADNSATRAHGGAGLGLAITRRVARLMGGDAGARSTPGQGSTFWLTARLRREPAPAAATPAATR
ncbi:MAG: ATP-binding protein [Burkholderiales bacterium]